MSNPEPTPEPIEIDPAEVILVAELGVDTVTLGVEAPDGTRTDTVARPGLDLQLVPITDSEAEPAHAVIVLSIPQAYGLIAGLIDALGDIEGDTPPATAEQDTETPEVTAS